MHTLEYSHSRRIVVDSSRGSQGSGDDGGGGDEVVGEGVVEVALQLEDVLHLLEFFLVSASRTCVSEHEYTYVAAIIPRGKLFKTLLVMRVMVVGQSLRGRGKGTRGKCGLHSLDDGFETVRARRGGEGEEPRSRDASEGCRRH